MGDAPDLMTHARMSALVAPIDSSLLAPFYADVNINNSKFKWYRTGQPGKKSASCYAVPISFCLFCFCFSWHSTIAPYHLFAAAHVCQLPGPGQRGQARTSFARTRLGDSVEGCCCLLSLLCVVLLSSLVIKLACMFSLCTTSLPKYFKKQEQRIRMMSTATSIQLMAVFALMRIGSR